MSNRMAICLTAVLIATALLVWLLTVDLSRAPWSGIDTTKIHTTK